MSAEKQILLDMVHSMNEEDASKALDTLKQVFVISVRRKTWDDIETIKADSESDALIKKIRGKQDGYGEYVQ